MHAHPMKRITQGAAVLLLSYSTMVRADDCTGGMDATCNECRDEQSERSLRNAAPGANKVARTAVSRIVFVNRAERIAQTRLAEAKLRQGEAAAAVNIAEANLVAARKAVADAQYAPRR
jgi:hypothetical protein